jgi:hypothetical protein
VAKKGIGFDKDDIVLFTPSKMKSLPSGLLRLDIEKMYIPEANRVARGFFPPAHTPPGVRVRTGRFPKGEMGSPIKGPVKRKNTSPYKKTHLFFACLLTFAPAQPRFIVTFFRSRYFFHLGF